MMARTLLCLCGAALLSLAAPLGLSAQNVSSSESTTTATVDRIDRFSRTLTLRRDGDLLQMVTVDPSEKLFDDLKTGDRITVRITQSVVVKVNPNAPLGLRDSTAAARSANDQVVDQLTEVVTIDRLDPDGQYIVYRSDDGLRARRVVSDRSLLKGIREGDRVEITLTRERAVSIERARR